MEFLAQTRDGESLFPFSLRGELLTLPTEDDSNNYIYDPIFPVRVFVYRSIASIDNFDSAYFQLNISIILAMITGTS